MRARETRGSREIIDLERLEVARVSEIPRPPQVASGRCERHRPSSRGAATYRLVAVKLTSESGIAPWNGVHSAGIPVGSLGSVSMSAQVKKPFALV